MSGGGYRLLKCDAQDKYELKVAVYQHNSGFNSLTPEVKKKVYIEKNTCFSSLLILFLRYAYSCFQP
jgi:hypothetical protein